MDVEMNPTQVLNAALHLSHPARAFIAERLLESLDAEPDFPLSAKWQKEIVQRRKEIDCGKVELLPGEQVFEQAFENLM
jgi:putative addiction module component (TIGR02574 family)